MNQTGTSLVDAVWIESVGLNLWKISWHDSYPLETDYAVFSNDILCGRTKNKWLTVSPENLKVSSGNRVDIDVVRADYLQISSWNEYTLFAYPISGNRVRLSWTQIDLTSNPDFSNYVLYWNEGSGDPETVLGYFSYETITYTTEILDADGTYSFALALQDNSGNISTVGTPLVFTIDNPPDVPTSILVYNEDSKKATISWDAVSGSDIAGYYVKINHVPGEGIIDNVVSTIKVYTEELSYESFQLYAGDWIFQVVAVDEKGNESDGELLYLSLELTSAGLLETSNKPDAPYTITAWASAGGTITAQIYLTNVENLDTVYLYVDGAENETTAIVEGQYVYTIVSSALTDGTEYAVTGLVSSIATSYLDARLSDPSEAVYVTADATAPTGSTTLTGELI